MELDGEVVIDPVGVFVLEFVAVPVKVGDGVIVLDGVRGGVIVLVGDGVTLGQGSSKQRLGRLSSVPLITHIPSSHLSSPSYQYSCPLISSKFPEFPVSFR